MNNLERMKKEVISQIEKMDVSQFEQLVENEVGRYILAGGRTVRLIEDVICIILLIFLPDYLLEKMGLYNSIQTVIYRRVNEREDSYADYEQYAETHGIDTEDDWLYAGLKRAIEIVKAGETDE